MKNNTEQNTVDPILNRMHFSISDDLRYVMSYEICKIKPCRGKSGFHNEYIKKYIKYDPISVYG